jgi:Putative transposase
MVIGVEQGKGCRSTRPGACGMARSAPVGASTGAVLPRCVHRPRAGRRPAFHNKAVVYSMLFRAAAQALRDVAADRRYLGADLGRYIHRVAIANSRLVALEDSQVSFTWKDYRQDGKVKVMPSAAACSRCRRLSRRQRAAGRIAYATSPAAKSAATGSKKHSACAPLIPSARYTIPIALAVRGLVQSGFNEVALRAVRLSGSRDLTEASRFRGKAAGDSDPFQPPIPTQTSRVRAIPQLPLRSSRMHADYGAGFLPM